MATNKTKTSSIQKTAKTPKDKSKTVNPSPKQARSFVNIIAMIIAIIIGIAIITGSAILSLTLLPNTKENDTQSDAPSTDTIVYKPLNIAHQEPTDKTSDEPDTNPKDQNDTKNSDSKPAKSTTSTPNKTTPTATKKPTTTTTTAKPNTNTSNSATTNDGCNGAYWIETVNDKTTIMCEKDRPVLVKTVTDNRDEPVANKFGTRVWREIRQKYDLYSDGSKRNTTGSTNLRYDYSKYNATTAQLKAEANSLKNSERTTINRILALTNQLRAEKGLAPLQLDDNLTTAANFRAAETAWSGQFSHTRPNGTSCFTAGTELGINFYGENLAYGSSGTTADKVINMWRNSAGHYQNIIDSKYTKIGIGAATCGDIKYFVQVFAY